MATLNDWLTKRPVNRTAVDAHKNRMLSDIRAYKLREFLCASKSRSVTSGSRLDNQF